MLKYILEIKNRLLLLFITCISTVFVCYFYKEILLFIITKINENYYPTSFYFIFTNLIEIFNVYTRLIIFVNNQILILYFFYHFFYFISPSLFKLEYKHLHFIVKRTILLWVLSVIFFNYIFIPITWNFFLSFQSFISVNLYFEAKLSEFIIFYVSLYYLCISYCLVFMVLLFIISYTNLNTKFIRKFRKLYYYLFIIFSTMISPPDIFSQFFISLLIILIYEILVFTSILKFRLIN